MSQQKRSDWKDDSQFDSMEGEPFEGFADLEDDYSDETAETDAEAIAKDEEDPAVDADDATRERASGRSNPQPMPTHGRRGISSAELGVLFSTCTLVAGVGVGGACLLAAGVAPQSLWQPDALLTWQNYADLTEHPVNLLALVLVGMLTLTLLGSRAIAKAARGASDRYRAAESVLNRLTTLRLDDEDGWQGDRFRDHPAAATFVAEVLGAWRLRAARQRRYMGLEGELRRLEKALADNNRQDLTGRFDNPAVGSLSDEMVRYFDERAAAVREASESEDRLSAQASVLIGLIQDARSWTRSTQETIADQGRALDRLAVGLQDAGSPTITAAAAKVVDGLREIGDRFQPQSDRLLKLGESVAELTGAAFDTDDFAAGDPDSPPPGGLTTPRENPFWTPQADVIADVDPFAGSTMSFGRESYPDDAPTPESLDAPVTADAPPSPDPSPEPLRPVADAPSSTEDSFVFDRGFGAEPFGQPAETPPPGIAVQPPLSDADEKVYDLDEFVAAPDEPTAQIYDLADFGAVNLGSEAGDDPIYDLADFGALRLDKGDRARPEDRIYDLAELGAVAVN